MPAHRNRTQRWRDSLRQIRDRGGGLEFTIDADAEGAKNLVWRVRLFDFDDERMIVEHPGALGRAFPVGQGASLIGVITVGQNRWMFRSRVLSASGADGVAPDRLVVETPDRVERCTRRASGRTSIGSIDLPGVDLWPLLDPGSARPVELASRMLIEGLRREGRCAEDARDETMLPEVGPRTPARLANIGGGGAGLVLDPEYRDAVGRHGLYWVAIDLRPMVPAPLSVCARLAHSHTDSQQRIYAGMAFEFSRGSEHKAFIVGEISAFVAGSHAGGSKRAA